MSRVLVTGGAGMIGQAIVRAAAARPGLRGPRLRPARGAGLDPRGRRGPHRRPARCRRRRARALDGATHVIHCAAIVGGIANFHRLPYTLTEVNNALYNARHRRRARASRSSASSTSRARWCSSARRCSRPRRITCPTASRRARPTASRSSTGEVYCRAAHERVRAAVTRSAARSTPTGPGELADRRAGHRPRRAGPDPQGARRAAPAADLRLRRADAHADPRRRHRRRRGRGAALAGRR